MSEGGVVALLLLVSPDVVLVVLLLLLLLLLRLFILDAASPIADSKLDAKSILRKFK